MISVDAVTGEIYLQLNPKSKTEDVAKYLVELCEDARKENVEKLFIRFVGKQKQCIEATSHLFPHFNPYLNKQTLIEIN